MSASLIIYIGEGVPFDFAVLRDAIDRIPGVHDIRLSELDGAVLQARFEGYGDSTMMRVLDDSETIAIDGTGLASFCLAIEIAKRLPLPIRMIDSYYSFDIELDPRTTPPELMRSIGMAHAGDSDV
jgi:hypothetical protein